MNRIDRIKGLGVNVGADYEYVGEGEERHRVERPDIVTGVNPNFTAEEWCSLAMREGVNYAGGCCGNTSYMQDIVNAAFRDSGWIDAHNLLALGEMARSHEGFETFAEVDDEAFEELIQAWVKHRETPPPGTISNTWGKLGVIYNAVEPNLKPQRLDAPRARYTHEGSRETEEQFTVRALENTLAYMGNADLFGPERGQIKPESYATAEAYAKATQRHEDHVEQHTADAILLRARAMPLMLRLLAEIEEHYAEVFEGYALVKPGTDEPLMNGRGPCVYRTTEAAQRMVELWERIDLGEGERVEYELVPVTVTVERGLEVHRG